jgi:8-oxo-dGTP pyrophosphatase MutT (NUDIX family)
MLELLEQGGRALQRDNYAPGHFTASAFVVDAGYEHVLLVHHRKLGRWLQPGGHVEPSDLDVLAAARREVAEETGVASLSLLREGLFDLDIHAIPTLGDQPAHLHFDLRSLFRADDLELSPNDEVEDVRWVRLAELSTVSDDESVLRVAKKLLG